jgi:hypothetical protein
MATIKPLRDYDVHDSSQTICYSGIISTGSYGGWSTQSWDTPIWTAQQKKEVEQDIENEIEKHRLSQDWDF